jgi:hypothetical protein
MPAALVCIPRGCCGAGFSDLETALKGLNKDIKIAQNRQVEGKPEQDSRSGFVRATILT